MKPITKSISYGYSKSVQLFTEDGLKKDSVFILLISDRDISGDLRNVAEYRYDSYVKAVGHLHQLLLNYIYFDLSGQ